MNYMDFPSSAFPDLASSRAFVAFGAGADMDEAFDYASRIAEESAPHSHDAWLTQAKDPGALGQDPVHPDQALAQALALLASPEPVPTGAFPLASLSAFTKSRARVLLEDISLPVRLGVILPTDPDYSTLFDAAVLACPPSPGQPVRVDVARALRRFKPVAEVFRSPSSASFALMWGDFVLADGFHTAGDARRAGLAMLKDMEGEDDISLEVVKIARRSDGPLIRLDRNLTKSAVRAAVLFVAPKSATMKTSGWLFAGRVE